MFGRFSGAFYVAFTSDRMNAVSFLNKFRVALLYGCLQAKVVIQNWRTINAYSFVHHFVAWIF